MNGLVATRLIPRSYSKVKRLIAPTQYANPNLTIAANFVSSRNIEGDYYEFGLYRGASFACAYHELTHARRSMLAYHQAKGLPVPKDLVNSTRFYGFDSFEGLPEPLNLDKLPSHWEIGQFRCSYDEFLSNISRAGVDLSEVHIIQGLFSSTLNPGVKKTYLMSKASIVHVDCDLYESTLDVLEFIRDLLVDGSVIIFDDWFGFKGNPSYGEQRAFREWSEKYGVLSSELSRFNGQSVAFIIHGDTD